MSEEEAEDDEFLGVGERTCELVDGIDEIGETVGGGRTRDRWGGISAGFGLPASPAPDPEDRRGDASRIRRSSRKRGKFISSSEAARIAFACLFLQLAGTEIGSSPAGKFWTVNSIASSCVAVSLVRTVGLSMPKLCN